MSSMKHIQKFLSPGMIFWPLSEALDVDGRHEALESKEAMAGSRLGVAWRPRNSTDRLP